MDAELRSLKFNSGAPISLTILVLLLGNPLFAQQSNSTQVTTTAASPAQDDARIHDVAIIRSDLCWGVGDRGTIWKSGDGGITWNYQYVSPELSEFSLECVHFLTDRVGWIAGGAVSAVGRVQHGIVLFTMDGGEQWEVLSHSELPYIRKVQFFNLEEGIAVGERSAQYPAGLMQTRDGGKSWSSINADHNATWNDAHFFEFRAGLLVGSEGRQASFANGKLFTGGGNLGGLEALHQVSAESSGYCWMVGDGALALLSLDRGVSWSPPQSRFPREFNDFVNFRCVTQKEGHVWMGGTPGSVIWHSADQGRTWEEQTTGDVAPLKTIAFRDSRHGVAAGDFGRVITTQDGGKTWVAARGTHRRLACWALHGHTSRIPFSFLTRWAREAGYRTGVTLTTRRDLGVDAYDSKDDRIRFEQAVLQAGGNTAQIDWRLPLTLPGLDRNAERLQQEWSKLTDQRLREVLLGNLVAQIRTWQPDVILLDEPPVDDVVTLMLHQALPEAVDDAGNPSRFPQQIAYGLSPWAVKKVVLERAPGRRGTISQDPFEILPHLGTTLDVAQLQAASRIYKEVEVSTPGRGYEVLYVRPDQDLNKSTVFNDLRISPDSAARRAVPSLTSVDFEHLVDEVQHRRMMAAMIQGIDQRPDQGAQLLAQLGDMLRPLSNEQAARQLSDLAVQYRQGGQWTLAQETYSQLIINYPEQPVALEAMLWLVEFLTSAEMNWQRLKAINASHSNVRVNQATVQANFERALEMAGKNATHAGFLNEIQHLKQGVDSSTTAMIPTLGGSPGVLNGSQAGANQYEMQLQRWHETASNIVNDLSAAYPRLFAEDEMQFVVAALHRRRQQGRKADEIYGSYLQRLNDDDPWHVAAKGETYLLRPGALSPKPVLRCHRALAAPVLDGRLTDVCWTNADEIKLQTEATQDVFVGTDQRLKGRVEFLGRQPIVMFLRDADYLYIGASVPKHEDVRYAPTQLPGRPVDADLGQHDYLTFQFDIDRDYATYYRFDVDQRGWSREACWDAWSYNPSWFIASEQDATTWTIEVAIPLKELLPSELNLTQTWAVGVTRVMPGAGVQSWTNSGGEKPVPPRFGLLRFE